VGTELLFTISVMQLVCHISLTKVRKCKGVSLGRPVLAGSNLAFSHFCTHTGLCPRHKHTHLHAEAHTHTYTKTHKLIHTRTHACKHTHAHTHIRTQRHKLTHTHAHMHASIHTHTRTQVLLRARPTVGKSDLEVFERFTQEFGEEAS